LFQHLNKREHLKKSVGQAVSQRLQPTQSSVRGDEAICLAYNLSRYHSSTSVGQARTHCVQPIHVW
jgi:hypothetical protein